MNIDVYSLFLTLFDSNYLNSKSNYKFYLKTLRELCNMSGKNESGQYSDFIKKLDGYNNSSPSTCYFYYDSERIILTNIRYVNYKIDNKGVYNQCSTITTQNWLYMFKNGKLINEFELNYDRTKDNFYVGLEDVRLFTRENDTTIYFTCNRGLGYNKIVVEYGTIDLINKRANSRMLIHPTKMKSVEKNWVLFSDAIGQMKIIYEFYPKISVGNIEGNIFQETHSIDVPNLFSHLGLRGSSHGAYVKSRKEIWFLVHYVDDTIENRRRYYHMFVVLDDITYKLIKFSYPFSFEMNHVEYALSMLYLGEDGNKEGFHISYSINDSTSQYELVYIEELDKICYKI